MQFLTFEEIQRLKDNLTEEEYLQLIYYNYPSVWLEENLRNPQNPDEPLKLRFYQTEIINDHSQKKILRLGRQMGKSCSIQMLILIYGLMYPNSKILVIGPQKTHVEQIFDEVELFASYTPSIKARITTKRQPMSMKFKCISGGTNTCLFLTTGEDSGGKGLSIRGKTSNVLIVDEADYINDKVMQEVVIPTTNSYMNPTIILSSTPTGRRGFFRNTWDSGFYKTFHYRSDQSPAWSKEKEEEIRASITKGAYIHEYEANWGDTEGGVFGKDDMQICTELSKVNFPSASTPQGIIRQYKYKDDGYYLDSIIKHKCRILGVDWNGSGNGVRLVWSDFDDKHNIWIRGKWNIDQADFTQNAAMSKIIELHRQLKFDHIMVDIGYGRTQIEDLHLYGLSNPSTKLDKVVIGVATDGQMDIVDIASGETRKTYTKNFIVESMIRYVEQHRVRYPEDENLALTKRAVDERASLCDEMNEYVIEKYTANGRPIYRGKAGDHDLDALMFCLYGYITEVVKTQNLWEKVTAARPTIISYDKILNNRANLCDPDKKTNEQKIDKYEEVKKTFNNTYATTGYTHRMINKIGNNKPFSRGMARGKIGRTLR